MATNPYFHSNYFATNEQDLVHSLYQEAIQQQGYDMFYLPMEHNNYDYLFGEDGTPNYKKSYQLEVYVKDVNGYGGEGQVLSKLGLDIRDELTIQISIRRFKEVVTTNETAIIRPREGDLVYFALDYKSLFEITYVENKIPFFQLGDLYMYEVSMKRFVYGAQTLDTGNKDIDDFKQLSANTTLVLGTDIGFMPFIENEIIYQLNPDNQTYRASATFLKQDGLTITVTDVFGEFAEGVNIQGEDSGAVYSFPIKSRETYDDVSSNKVSDNVAIEVETEDMINEDERNPFINF